MSRKCERKQPKKRYVVHKGSPESLETRAETALQADTPPPTQSTALAASAAKCTYCQRDNHVTRDCRTLQRDLLAGKVKPGTTIPDNFIVTIPNRFKSPQPNYGDNGSYRGRGTSFRGRSYGGRGFRGHGGGRGHYHGGRGSYDNYRDKNQSQGSTDVIELFDRFGNSIDVPRDHVNFQSRNDTRNDYGVIAISTTVNPAISLTAAAIAMDPAWIVDSGCTRHITAIREWFTDLAPSTGSITVGGKNEIPIEGTGTVRLLIGDNKNIQREIILDNMLYAPQLKFNLFSVPSAVRGDLKHTFDTKKCTLFYANRYKLFARMVDHSDLYHFRAAPHPISTQDSASANISSAGKFDKVILWHKRLGHPNFRILQAMSNQDPTTDLPPSGVDRDAFCSACVYAESHRAPFNTTPVERAQYPLQKVHSDIAGPLPVPTLSGCNYFVTFIDDNTRFTYNFVIARKSDIYECYERFRMSAQTLFRRHVETLEYRANHHDPEIQTLQMDNAREYEKLGRVVRAKYGAHPQFTNAYTPQQNGIAERRMRTLLEKIRVFLIDGNLPHQLWGECVTHACTLMNMTPSATIGNISSYEKWYQRQPSLEYLRVFGCAAYAHVPPAHCNKLESRASPCMYIGLPRHKKGFRLLNINTLQIVYSRDVTFNEHEFPKLALLRTPHAQTSNDNEMSTTSFQSLPPLRTILPASGSPNSAGLLAKRPHSSADELPIKQAKHDPLTPADVAQSVQILSNQLSLLPARHIPEPSSYREAMRSDYASEWRSAADAEFNSLMENKTWSLVPRPLGRTILANRWVFVIKHNGNGDIDRFKARLVIKGFLQRPGLDYDEIFSPVIRMEVLRLLLTTDALLDYEIHQMDVKTAFLNGDIDVDIYMHQPEGFIESGKEHLVCKLAKILYGLKQASRVWYQTLCDFLESMGFRRLIKDSSGLLVPRHAILPSTLMTYSSWQRLSPS